MSGLGAAFRGNDLSGWLRCQWSFDNQVGGVDGATRSWIRSRFLDPNASRSGRLSCGGLDSGFLQMKLLLFLGWFGRGLRLIICISIRILHRVIDAGSGCGFDISSMCPFVISHGRRRGSYFLAQPALLWLRGAWFSFEAFLSCFLLLLFLFLFQSFLLCYGLAFCLTGVIFWSLERVGMGLLGWLRVVQMAVFRTVLSAHRPSILKRLIEGKLNCPFPI